MIEVVRVWKGGKHVSVEVKDIDDVLLFVKKMETVWDEKQGEKAPSKDEAVALFGKDDGIN